MSQQPQYSPDGRWWWDGQQWQPVPEQPRAPAQSPTPPRKPRRKWPWIAGGIVAVFVIIIIAASAANGGSGGKTPKASPTAAAAVSHGPTTAPTHAPAPTKAPAPAPKTLIDMSGTANAETPAFTAPATYTVNYSFDCSNLGTSGNFAIEADDNNGQPRLGQPGVNRLAMSGQGSAKVRDINANPGTHLQILSECNWHVSVTG